MIFDVYKNIRDDSLRIATAPGAGLSTHIKSDEWQKMKPGESAVVIDDAEDDIAARGFCFYRLVEKR